MEEYSKEREAALFLVSQMKIIMEEKNQIAMENEQMHLQTQELIDEIKRLNMEVEAYSQFNEESGFGAKDGKSGVVSLAKMKAKIDELQDLAFELKNKEGVAKVAELMEVINNVEQSLTKANTFNDELKNKLLNAQANNTNLNEQNCIEFFSKLLDDKDQKIAYLIKQNEFLQSKEKQYQLEIEKLKEYNKNVSLQFDNYKATQSRLEDVITNRGGQSLNSLYLNHDQLKGNVKSGTSSAMAEFGGDDRFNKESYKFNLQTPKPSNNLYSNFDPNIELNQ